MGANKFFFSQFRKGLNLFADYQFNNNLIDDANGYNLTGTDITYNNGNAVFNGVTSVARRTDAEDLFSFTDGTNDLPFKIETSVKFNDFTKPAHTIVKKRDAGGRDLEWQLILGNNSSEIQISLYSLNLSGQISGSLGVKKTIIQDTNIVYNIVVSYDGSKTLDGLNLLVNGVSATDKSESNYSGMSKTGAFFTVGSTNLAGDFDLDGQIDYLKIYK